MSEANSTDQYVYQVHGWKPEIIRHRLVKWSQCFVTYYCADWKRERRQRHEGEFFRSWAEAHAAMNVRCEKAIERCRESLHKLQSELGQIRSLKEPSTNG